MVGLTPGSVAFEAVTVVDALFEDVLGAAAAEKEPAQPVVLFCSALDGDKRMAIDQHIELAHPAGTAEQQATPEQASKQLGDRERIPTGPITLSVHTLQLELPLLRELKQTKQHVWISIDPFGRAHELEVRHRSTRLRPASLDPVLLDVHELLPLLPGKPLWEPVCEALCSVEEQDSDVYFVLKAGLNSEHPDEVLHVTAPGLITPVNTVMAAAIDDEQELGMAHVNLKDLLKREHEPTCEAIDVLDRHGKRVASISITLTALASLRYALGATLERCLERSGKAAAVIQGGKKLGRRRRFATVATVAKKVVAMAETKAEVAEMTEEAVEAERRRAAVKAERRRARKPSQPEKGVSFSLLAASSLPSKEQRAAAAEMAEMTEAAVGAEEGEGFSFFSFLAASSFLPEKEQRAAAAKAALRNRNRLITRRAEIAKALKELHASRVAQEAAWTRAQKGSVDKIEKEEAAKKEELAAARRAKEEAVARVVKAAIEARVTSSARAAAKLKEAGVVAKLKKALREWPRIEGVAATPAPESAAGDDAFISPPDLVVATDDKNDDKKPTDSSHASPVVAKDDKKPTPRSRRNRIPREEVGEERTAAHTGKEDGEERTAAQTGKEDGEEMTAGQTVAMSVVQSVAQSVALMVLSTKLELPAKPVRASSLRPSPRQLGVGRVRHGSPPDEEPNQHAIRGVGRVRPRQSLQSHTLGDETDVLFGADGFPMERRWNRTPPSSDGFTLFGSDPISVRRWPDPRARTPAGPFANSAFSRIAEKSAEQSVKLSAIPGAESQQPSRLVSRLVQDNRAHTEREARWQLWQKANSSWLHDREELLSIVRRRREGTHLMRNAISMQSEDREILLWAASTPAACNQDAISMQSGAPSTPAAPPSPEDAEMWTIGQAPKMGHPLHSPLGPPIGRSPASPRIRLSSPGLHAPRLSHHTPRVPLTRRPCYVFEEQVALLPSSVSPRVTV